jgi:hypothetical protein
MISSIAKLQNACRGNFACAGQREATPLEGLHDPRAHFPPLVVGDAVEDGVCGALIAEKLGVSIPQVRASKGEDNVRDV